MIRITSNRALLIAGVLALGIAGCSDPYDHESLGDQSPEYRQVETMIQQIRQHDGDVAGLAKTQGASSLSETQMQSLIYSLRRIADAKNASLHSVDAFGPQVFRAKIELKESGNTQTMVMLLVRPDENELFWAGPN